MPSRPLGIFLKGPERRALLAGTALVSTLIAAGPSPASAQVAVFRPLSLIPVTVTNHSDCIFPGTCALINTIFPGAFIDFTNTGDFAVVGIGASAIFTQTNFGFSPIDVVNSGNLATAGFGAIGIEATTYGRNSPISIVNSGDLATIGLSAHGIYGYTLGRNSNLSITNSGAIATRGAYAGGLVGYAIGVNSDLSITNSGDVVTRGALSHGIFGYTYSSGSSLTITNSGTVSTSGRYAVGIIAATGGDNSDLSIVNSGEIFTSGIDAEGVYVTTFGNNSTLRVVSSGKITTTAAYAEGIYAATYGTNGDLTIVNRGEIETRGLLSDGIYAGTFGNSSPLTIQNSGSIRALGTTGYGMYAVTTGSSSPISIQNSGEVYGKSLGIYTYSATSTTITNSGSISAGSGLAIDTEGASTTINNTGLITGFVDLTGSRDIFNNNAGGEFNAMQTSYFGGGGDVFINNPGATLRTADNRNNSEFTSFEGLEQFKSRGVITMQDGKQGDVFMISNTVGGTDLSFDGSGDSTLKVDTFLDGPNTSKSDILIVEGDVTGKTLVQVQNTNPGAAQLDRKGIPVVFVEGDVNKSAFHLEKPIDAGFFDYDLIFRPTGSGVFEFKNHPGGGSHILPHLVTFSHDTFHNTTETWFDQSTDLRALLAEGSVCNDPARRQDVVRCEQLHNFTPGVWVRGAGAWLDLEDNATTRANGKTYRYNLDRDLDIWTFETGIDFGKRDLFADGDILVFGVLGGAVEASLEYKSLSRNFHLGGAEAGAYATYLNGGLFVDTLFKAHFLKLDPSDVRGFPDKLDSTTYGFRTDTGYRFGGMRHGPFFEPLATIAVSWNEMDDFAVDGNAIDFDDDEDVRGRVGLRLGTSSEVWEGTTMEPFVVGSLWGNLSGSHSTTLTSGGRTFEFTDDPEEVWGVVSGGVNFFNPGAQTAVFAKVDYTFAEQTEGVSVKGGMRYNW